MNISDKIKSLAEMGCVFDGTVVVRYKELVFLDLQQLDVTTMTEEEVARFVDLLHTHDRISWEDGQSTIRLVRSTFDKYQAHARTCAVGELACLAGVLDQIASHLPAMDGVAFAGILVELRTRLREVPAWMGVRGFVSAVVSFFENRHRHLSRDNYFGVEAYEVDRGVLVEAAAFYNRLIQKASENGMDITHVLGKGFASLEHDNHPEGVPDVGLEYAFEALVGMRLNEFTFEEINAMALPGHAATGEVYTQSPAEEIRYLETRLAAEECAENYRACAEIHKRLAHLRCIINDIIKPTS